MYTVFNHVRNKVVFYGTEREFIDFVKQIVIKNGDSDYSVLGVSDAIEYIDDYCNDLNMVV